MADERQILIASLREHFEGIVEATDLFLRTTDNGGDEEEGASLAELEAARGANSILKAESAEWRKRALEMKEELKSSDLRAQELANCCEKLGKLCQLVLQRLKDYDNKAYLYYQNYFDNLVNAISPHVTITILAQPKGKAKSSETESPAAKEAPEKAAPLAAEAAEKRETPTLKEEDPKPLAEEKPALEESSKHEVSSLASKEVEAQGDKEKEEPQSLESEESSKVSKEKRDPVSALRERIRGVSIHKKRALAEKKKAKEELPPVKTVAAPQVEAPAAEEVVVQEEVQPKVEIKLAAHSAPQLGMASSAPEPAPPTAEMPVVEENKEEVKEAPAAEPVLTPAPPESKKEEAPPAPEPEEPVALEFPLLAHDPERHKLEVLLNEELQREIATISDIIEQDEVSVTLPKLEFLSSTFGRPTFGTSDDPQLLEKIAQGREMLDKGQQSAGWDHFRQLIEEYGELLPLQFNLTRALVMGSCWEEAYSVGMPLVYDMAKSDDWDLYATLMAKALINCLKVAEEAADRRRLLFYLALINRDYPVTARKFLRMAVQEGGPMESLEKAILHCYLLRLSAAGKGLKLEDDLSALQEITVCPELFDELFSLADEPANKANAPAIKMLEALYLTSKSEAKQAEAGASGPRRFGPMRVTTADVEYFHNDESSGLIVEFMLNQLFPRAGYTAPSCSARVDKILADSKPIPFGFEPAGTLERFNSRLFKFPSLEIRYYQGEEKFWLEVSSSESKTTFVIHADMARMSAMEQQFVILRKCFQAFHHTSLWTSKSDLEPAMTLTMVQKAIEICVETGTEVPILLASEAKNCSLEKPNFSGRLQSLLNRLYRATKRSEFKILREFLFSERPFANILESDANRFAAKAVGLTEASYSLVRCEKGFAKDYEEISENGFCNMYCNLKEDEEYLRAALQRLWVSYFQDDLL